MKRILFYILILLAAMLIPQRGMDVGKLLPVELVSISMKETDVVIETDTGDWGAGKTLKEAFDNLEETTTGVIYLDTADYLLISSNAEQWAVDMEEYLKRDVLVCGYEGNAELVEAASYLAVHKPEVTLKELLQGEKPMQELEANDGRLKLKNAP